MRIIILTLCLATALSSQILPPESFQSQAIQNRTAEIARRQRRHKEEAVTWARARGLAVRQELPTGAVMEIMACGNYSIAGSVHVHTYIAC